MTQTDVFVAGLGPAGASAAAEAANAGLSVIAVDRKTAPGMPVQCAEFVPGMIGTEVRDFANVREQPISAMITTVENEPPDVTENFPGHIIDREAFDRHLVDQAVDAGAQTRFGISLRSMDDAGNVLLSDGSRLAPRVIIGADGPRSIIGQRIGAPNTEVVESRQLTAPLRQRHSATDIYLSARIPGGYGWLFPKRDVANLGIGVIPAAKQHLKPLLEELHETLVQQGRLDREVIGYTGGPIPVGGIVGPTGRVGSCLVLLAGDAAGLTNPVTGAGIYSAVVSGRLAGQYAEEYVSGSGDAACDYADELDALFAPALQRALRRRHQLLTRLCLSPPESDDLRRAWIAYPEYWASRAVHRQPAEGAQS